MQQLPLIIGLVTLGGILSLAGGFLVLIKEKTLRPYYLYLVALAAGVLISTALFDLIPEAIEHAELTTNSIDPLRAMAVGIGLFFILEKSVHWYHDHTGGDEHHAHSAVVPLIAIGDGLHNFIDGAIITAAVLADPRLGLVTAIAVFIHEFTQEIGDISVLLHCGLSRTKAALINLLSASTVYLGMFATLWLSQAVTAIEAPLLGFTAGAFLFIAIGELLPELTSHQSEHKVNTPLLILTFLFGLFLVDLLGQVITISHP